MEHNVTTLETSKRLKAAGFPQTTYFDYWNEQLGHHDNASWAIEHEYVGYQAAPAAQEIADQLPPTFMVQRCTSVCNYHVWVSGHSADGDTIAEALALLWLKLNESTKEERE